MRQRCPNCPALVPLPETGHGPIECPECLTEFLPIGISSGEPEPTEPRRRNPLVAVLALAVLIAACAGVWVVVSRSGAQQPKPPEPRQEPAAAPHPAPFPPVRVCIPNPGLNGFTSRIA